MKLKHLALVTVTALGVLLPSAAQALQWVEVAKTYDGTSAYVDKHSVKRRGNTVQFWIYYVSRDVLNRGNTSTKLFAQASCGAGNYRVLREIDYVNGQVRSDTKTNTVLEALPDSLAEAALDAVCQR